MILWTCRVQPRSVEEEYWSRAAKLSPWRMITRVETSPVAKEQQNIWTEPPSLPAGHWENRPKKDEQKEALRKKLEEHQKQKLEEHQKQKLRNTFEQHFAGKGSGGPSSGIAMEATPSENKDGGESKGGSKGKKADPGPDEAGSDPSSSEETESSDECDDPVQEPKDLV